MLPSRPTWQTWSKNFFCEHSHILVNFHLFKCDFRISVMRRQAVCLAVLAALSEWLKTAVLRSVLGICSKLKKLLCGFVHERTVYCFRFSLVQPKGLVIPVPCLTESQPRRFFRSIAFFFSIVVWWKFLGLICGSWWDPRVFISGDHHRSIELHANLALFLFDEFQPSFKNGFRFKWHIIKTGLINFLHKPGPPVSKN